MTFRQASPYHAESDPPGYRICWAGDPPKYTASRNGSPSILLLTTPDKDAAKAACVAHAREAK